MIPDDGYEGRLLFKILCSSGRTYLIYHGSEAAQTPEHLPEKWYFQPYPFRPDYKAGTPFDNADLAARGARSWDERHRPS